jgi:hypothetical protein
MVKRRLEVNVNVYCKHLQAFAGLKSSLLPRNFIRAVWSTVSPGPVGQKLGALLVQISGRRKSRPF